MDGAIETLGPWEFGSPRLTSTRWTVPLSNDHAGIRGSLRFRLSGGLLGCVGVSIDATDSRPISGPRLAAIPWGKAVAAAAKLIGASAEWMATAGIWDAKAGGYIQAPLGSSRDEWEALRASAAMPGEVSACEPVEVPDPCRPPCGYRHYVPGPATVRQSAGGTALLPMAPESDAAGALVALADGTRRANGQPIQAPRRGRPHRSNEYLDAALAAYSAPHTSNADRLAAVAAVIGKPGRPASRGTAYRAIGVLRAAGRISGAPDLWE